jgi:hypothetical protein
MSELVSTFLPVALRGAIEYLFFIVTWTDYVTPISEQLEKQGKAFGADLGPKGAVIQAYGQYAKNTFAEVQAKHWPDEIRNRFKIEQDPFMLITRKDFQEFNPQRDPWAIIWFSSFRDQPESIYRVFGALARKVEHDDDVFQYAQSLVEKGTFRKLAKYFELKTPGILGFSLDVKAILQDIVGVDN